MDAQQNSVIRLPKLLESAAAVTIGIAAMYCVGWAFVDFYLYRLGIPHESIPFSSDYYLRLGAVPVCFVVVAVLLAVSKGKNKPLTIKESFAVNGHWFVFVFLLAFFIYLGGGSLRTLGVVFGAILAGSLMVFVLDKNSFGNIWWTSSIYKRLLLVGYAFVFMMLVSGFLGGIYARLVLEGKGLAGEKKIVIEPKDEELTNLKGREFTLVLYRDGMYYLIDSTNSPIEFPQVWLVPKEEIKYATMYRKRTQ